MAGSCTLLSGWPDAGASNFVVTSIPHRVGMTDPPNPRNKEAVEIVVARVMAGSPGAISRPRHPNTRKSSFVRVDAKFSANLRSYSVNFTVTLAPEKANFKVFVSKNRNLRSEHLRGAQHHISEHLAR
jgi:hypothetical protein